MKVTASEVIITGLSQLMCTYMCMYFRALFTDSVHGGGGGGGWVRNCAAEVKKII